MAKQTVGTGDCQTFKAAADYSSYQFSPVYISAADTVTVTGAAGVVDGILLNKPDAAGKAAKVCTKSGVLCKLAVDATSDIAAGDPLEANASSKGIKLTIDSDGGTETWLIGNANEVATAASSPIISVLTKFMPTAK